MADSYLTHCKILAALAVLVSQEICVLNLLEFEYGDMVRCGMCCKGGTYYRVMFIATRLIRGNTCSDNNGNVKTLYLIIINKLTAKNSEIPTKQYILQNTYRINYCHRTYPQHTFPARMRLF